jgi:glycosyltransferase involved in cell wall biosynthesis
MHTAWIIGLSVLGAIGLGFLLIPQIIYWQIKHPNTILGGEYVSDELLPYYYAASDISIIQRIDILNSGNVPLGMYFGNLILGPNVGNVNEILTETDNFVFDVNNLSNIGDIAKKMLASVEKQKGIKNREYVLSNLTTKKIAEETYQLYKSLILTL